MKTNTIFSLSVLAVFSGFFGSCTRSEVQQLSADCPVDLTVAMSDYQPSGEKGSSGGAFASDGQPANSSTRASEVDFQRGDKIGLYVTQGGSVVEAEGNHSSNVPYRYDGSWRAAGSLGGALISGTTYRATAYYPYKQGVSDPTKIEHSVATDQSAGATSSAGALELSDFMVSSITALGGVDLTPQKPTASLSFTHSMAKFIVTFVVPEQLDGHEVTGLTSILYKNFRLNCLVNVSTGGVSEPGVPVLGDITPRLTSSNGTLRGATVFYEAVVPPQSFGAGISLVLLQFATSDGQKELTYVVPQGGGVNLATNQKYTLTLSSVADIAFLSEVPSLLLLDGLAHTDIELKIKSRDNWKLSSPVSWLGVKGSSGSYATSVTGSGSDQEQTVYLELQANSSAVLARSGTLTLESTVDGKSRVTYVINQNYFSFNSPQTHWRPMAGASSSALLPIDGNQVFRIKSGADWVKLAKSAVVGQGDPVESLDVVGALGASAIWLQSTVNNSNEDRAASVSYTPIDLSGQLVTSQAKTQSVTQAKPAIADFVNTLPVQASGTAAEITAWTARGITPLAGLVWRLSAVDTDVVITPAAYTTESQSGAVSDISVMVKANNTASDRTVSYRLQYGDLGGGSPLFTAYSVVQSKPTLVLDPTSAFVFGPGAISSGGTFTVKVEKGVKWRVSLEAVAPTVQGDLTGFTFTPAVGVDQVGTGVAQTVSFTRSVGPQGGAVNNAKIVTTFGEVSHAGTNRAEIGLTHGLNLTIAPADAWAGVANTGGTREVTVTTLGTDDWTAEVSDNSGGGLSVSPASGKSGTKATITWAAQEGADPAKPARSGKVVFKTSPTGVSATVNTDQLIGDQFRVNPPAAGDYIKVGTLNWAKGSLISATIGAKVGSSTDYGLTFQFGSLVGWNPTTTATVAIAVKPIGYTGGTAWTTVGYYKDGSSGTIPTTDAPATGIGDPCRYYLGGKWRTPTTAEYLALFNNAGNGSSWATAGGSWQATPAGGNIRGLFFPAAGLRNFSAGSLTDVGSSGYYWSASVRNASGGYYLNFASSNVYPQNANGRPNGMPVRCVSGVSLLASSESVGAAAGSVTLSVEGTQGASWTIAESGDSGNAFSPSKTSGTGDGTLTITIAANATTAYRSAVYTLTSAGQTAAVTITQTQKVNPPSSSDYINIGNLNWTKGSLVADGSDAAKVGSSTDYGLTFQFGSLVGWNPTTTATVAIAVKPAGYTGGTAWTTVGRYTGGTTANETIPTTDSPATGIGDPCRYYLGGKWRTPTTAEYLALFNNAGNGSSWATVGGSWQATPAGGNIRGLFFPAAGLRNDSDGSLNAVGSYGYYWSASVSNASGGYYLTFTSSYVYPQNGGNRPHGMPVRCVSAP